MLLKARGVNKHIDGALNTNAYGGIAQNFSNNDGGKYFIEQHMPDKVVWDIKKDIQLIEVYTQYEADVGIRRLVEGILVKLEDVKDYIRITHYYEHDLTYNSDAQDYYPTSFFSAAIFTQGSTPMNLVPYPIYPFRVDFPKEWDGKFPYAVSSLESPLGFHYSTIPNDWDIVFTSTTYNGRPAFLIDTSMDLVYLYMGQPMDKPPFFAEVQPVVDAKVGVKHNIPLLDQNADSRVGAWISRAFRRAVVTTTNKITVKDLTKY